jgi:hypothetical protein
MFVWRDSIMVLGRYNYEKFNLTTQHWTAISTTPPADIYHPGCLVLPNEEILVVGGYFSPNQSFIYNHIANTWRTLSNTNAQQGNDKNNKKFGKLKNIELNYTYSRPCGLLQPSGL